MRTSAESSGHSSAQLGLLVFESGATESIVFNKESITSLVRRTQSPLDNAGELSHESGSELTTEVHLGRNKGKHRAETCEPDDMPAADAQAYEATLAVKRGRGNSSSTLSSLGTLWRW